MKKGKVMQVKDDYALILNENLNYEKIKSKNNLQVGSNIYYFENDLYKENKKNNVIQKVLLMASILFVIALINPTLLSLEESYGYISVDINPSVQMQINAKDQVMNFVPLNVEAEEIIDEDWVGLNYQDVIRFMINKSEDQGYLNEMNNFVFISYYSNDNQRTIEEKIRTSFANQYENVEIAITKAEKEDLEKATNDHKSLGNVVYNKKVAEKNQNYEKLQEKFEEKQTNNMNQEQDNNGIGNNPTTEQENAPGITNAQEEKIEQKTEEKINKTQEQVNQKVEKFEERAQENEAIDEEKTDEKIAKFEQKAEEKINKEVLKEMSKNDKEIKFIPNKKPEASPGQSSNKSNSNSSNNSKNNGNSGKGSK